MNTETGNRVLAALSASDLAALSPSLTPITLASGQVLYEPNARIEWVYFPDDAVTSQLSRMKDGSTIEIGTIGREGVVGFSVYLGADISIRQTIIQIPGDARRMPAPDFQSAVAKLPPLRAIMGRCTQSFLNQVSQTAACNSLHGIEERCARWLLLTHDRVGRQDTFPLTHLFLSFMLGVRRAGVTEALGALTRAQLIRSTRGSISILDRGGLEAASCECYQILHGFSSVNLVPASG